jgi:thioesterase DpgC
MSVGVYEELTARRTRFLRVEELCRLAAEKGALPPLSAMEAEAKRPLKDKQGLERQQGEFLAGILADPVCGTHLCHAMLLPHPDSRGKLKEYQSKGEIDLGGAHLKRQGKAAILTLKNPAHLNAEDETTLPGTEIAVDLALMDPEAAVCVLRGAPAEHPKYKGKRLFGAGINLTHLYQGKIRYLWYLIRDLGFVNKLYRGLAFPESSPELNSMEKLWIAAVEGFAIGGHCQILLTMDYTIGAKDAYLTLPARKEGIVPGAANLRLPRFVGDRIARQAVMAELRIDCDSAAGRMICDEIVPPEEVDSAIQAVVENLTTSGVVSAAGNRRAFRAGEEPLDAFRRYMSVYAREQAQCHLSPQLVANLERNWKTK